MNMRPIRFAGLLLLLLALPAFANSPEPKPPSAAQEGIQVPGPPFTSVSRTSGGLPPSARRWA